MRLDAPGYVLVVLPILAALVWSLSRSDGDRNPAERTLAVVGALAIVWILVTAIAAYA
jgi:hypothetical protein